MVPNIVHYIMLRPDNPVVDQNATFLQYLSFLGVHQHIKPSHIIIHGNVLPQGAWWRRTVNDVANIYFVNMTDVPTEVYGKPLKLIEHRTDIIRYRILYGMPIFLNCVPKTTYFVIFISQLVVAEYCGEQLTVSRRLHVGLSVSIFQELYM